MTEQWILQDINRLLQHRQRVVFYDPTGQCGFLMPVLQHNQITILKTDPSISENGSRNGKNYCFGMKQKRVIRDFAQTILEILIRMHKNNQEYEDLTLKNWYADIDDLAIAGRNNPNVDNELLENLGIIEM